MQTYYLMQFESSSKYESDSHSMSQVISLRTLTSLHVQEGLGMVTVSLASHTLRREEGSGHAAILDLSPQQKLDVTNQICALRSSYPLSWSSNYVTFSRCQHLII